MTRGIIAAAVLATIVMGGAPMRASAAPETGRVLIVALTGVTWEDIDAAATPGIDALVAAGSVAAMSPRAAVRGATPARGYLTLGAGNRALSRRLISGRDEAAAHLAFRATDEFENGTAADAVARRIGRPPRGSLVHVSIASLAAQSRAAGFETRIGALGEALAEHGITRGVVSAADTGPAQGRLGTLRRDAVLGLVDRTGSVDTGTLDGLLRPAPDAPFGVETDPDRFLAAVSDALASARVVLADPGETLRADEAALTSTPEQSSRLRRAALLRTDAIIARLAGIVTPDDRIYVVGVSSPLAESQDHLTPLIASGRGGWLTSPTTRRDGIVALTDVAPTVLRDVGLAAPSWMAGTPITSAASRSDDRVAALARLDEESIFRERFVAVVTTVLLVLLMVLALLAFVAFLTPRAPRALVASCAYAILALPLAVNVLRAVHADGLGLPGATLALALVIAVLSMGAALVPGPRTRGAVALLLASAAVAAGDVVAGSPLQLNGVFGYSPIVAGRFYGIGNLGYAVLFAAGILGLTGLADGLGARGAPLWLVGGLAALVVLDGLPQLGADFGGTIAGVLAVLVTIAAARGVRIGLRRAATWAVAAGVAGAGVMAIDLLRPLEQRTHLGRFAGRVLDSGLPTLAAFVLRKVEANLSILRSSAWTWSIPVTVAVGVLLLWRGRGVLNRVLPAHPLLRAGLLGSLVAGIAAFAVNDSGIAIPGMVSAHLVPFFVLAGLDFGMR